MRHILGIAVALLVALAFLAIAGLLTMLIMVATETYGLSPQVTFGMGILGAMGIVYALTLVVEVISARIAMPLDGDRE